MKHDEHILTYYPDVRCEKHMIEVFPEACLEFVASGDKAVASVPVDFAVEDGKSYCVTFDLVEHEIEAAGAVIAADRFSISASGGQMTVSVAEAGHHSVRVVVCEEVFTKLPSEYLPFGDKTTTVKEVLAECQPEFAADMSSFMLPELISLAEDEAYIVNWNGVEYTCTAVGEYGETGELETVMLGNVAMLNGSGDTGEPFVVAVTYLDNMTVFIPLDGSTTLTISIRQEVTTVQKMSGKYVEGMGYEEDGVVHPIDPKFLPKLVVTFTRNSNGRIVADKPHTEIVNAFLANRPVVGIADGSLFGLDENGDNYFGGETKIALNATRYSVFDEVEECLVFNCFDVYDSLTIQIAQICINIYRGVLDSISETAGYIHSAVT